MRYLNKLNNFGAKLFSTYYHYFYRTEGRMVTSLLRSSLIFCIINLVIAYRVRGMENGSVTNTSPELKCTNILSHELDFDNSTNEKVCNTDNSTLSTESTVSTTTQTSIRKLVMNMKKLLVFVDPVLYVVGLFLTSIGLYVSVVNRRKDTASDFIIVFLSNNFCLLTMNALGFLLYETKYNNLNSTTLAILKWIILIVQQTINIALKSISYALYTVMSMNSFVAVAFPFYMNRFVLSQHPKRLILVLLVFNMIFFSLNIARFEISPWHDKSSGQISFRLGYTDFATENMNFFNIYGFIGIFVVYLVPIPTTVVFFVLTLVFLRRSVLSKALYDNNKVRQAKTNHTRRLTKVFMIICFIQILIGVPYAIGLLMAKFDNDFKIGGNKSDYISAAFKIIITFEGAKHGLVCIIFLALSGSFRESFKKLFNYKRDCDVTNSSYRINKP